MATAQQEIQKEFGNYLRMRRAHAHLSLDRVAKRIGAVSVAFLSRIESGLASVPLGRVEAFANAYGIDRLHLARLVITISHRELYLEMISLFMQDGELMDTAQAFRKAKDPNQLRDLEKELRTGLVVRAFDEMREFIRANEKLVPRKTWNKKSFIGSADDFED